MADMEPRNQTSLTHMFSKYDTTMKTGSVNFVKNIISAAVSNICFLRAIFPADDFKRVAFGDENDSNVQVFLLDRRGSREAKQLVELLMSAYDALEKRYLRKLTLLFYEDLKRPEVNLEQYVFKLGYLKDQIQVDINGGRANDKKLSPINAMQDLIRNVLHLIDCLDVLPDKVYLNVKLTYCDDTPDDYEPQGYECASGIHFALQAGKRNNTDLLDLGSLETDHHSLSLKLKSACVNNQVLNCDDQEGHSVIDVLSSPESRDDQQQPELNQIVPSSTKIDMNNSAAFYHEENKLYDPHCIIKPESIEIVDLSNNQHVVNKTSSEKVKSEPEDIIESNDCICGNAALPSYDKLIKCIKCNKSEHATCYGHWVKNNFDISARHICVNCSTTNEPCESIEFVNDPEQIMALCFYRQALALISNESLKSMDDVGDEIVRVLHMPVNVAQQLLNRLRVDQIFTRSKRVSSTKLARRIELFFMCDSYSKESVVQVKPEPDDCCVPTAKSSVKSEKKKVYGSSGGRKRKHEHAGNSSVSNKFKTNPFER